MSQAYAKDYPEGSSNHIKKVAIVGVVPNRDTGWRLDGRHLLTAITRPDSSSQLPKGIQVVRVDYGSDDDIELVKALHVQEVLLTTMPVTASPDIMIKLIRGAAKAGVSYILPNWFGHDANNDFLCNDSMLSTSRDRALREIKRLGVSSYLLLNCNFWFEFSLGGDPDRFGFDFQNRSFVIFDKGDVSINTSTWPQCGRAVANLLSLKELPGDETDTSPTLSQFRNKSIYISSFRLSQLDMFDSVKRVTGTTDADWSITHESAEQRWKDGQAALKQGNWSAFTKMLYSRMFFPGSQDGDFETTRVLDNDLIDLPVEGLDEATTVGIQMGESS